MYKSLVVFIFKTFWRFGWGGGGEADSSIENLLSLWEGSQAELCGTASGTRFVAGSDISCGKSNTRKVSHKGELS